MITIIIIEHGSSPAAIHNSQPSHVVGRFGHHQNSETSMFQDFLLVAASLPEKKKKTFRDGAGRCESD